MANKVEPTSEKKIIEKKSKKKEKFFKTKLLDDDKKNTKSKKEKIKNKKLEPEKVIKEEPVLKQEIEKFEEQPKVEPKQQVIQEIKTENAEQNIQNFNCVISVQENIEQIDAIQLAVINAIVEHWQRPIGFAKDLSCKFKIKISQDGKIEEIICQELTGIPVYDSEARASLMRTNFPRLTWGMELTIKL
ncbi:TonB C-terminal domain-containing protein [Candidatus Dependentiae bacterium]|nr:TonB C-terminal domain-containing protein [Candidatus Dependentiae bacterium]